MVDLTLSLSEATYEWLRKKAAEDGITPEKIIEQHLAEWFHEDAEADPAFIAAMDASITQHRDLLKRLAQHPDPNIQGIIDRQLRDYERAFDRLAE